MDPQARVVRNMLLFQPTNTPRMGTSSPIPLSLNTLKQNPTVEAHPHLLCIVFLFRGDHRVSWLQAQVAADRRCLADSRLVARSSRRIVERISPFRLCHHP